LNVQKVDQEGDEMVRYGEHVRFVTNPYIFSKPLYLMPSKANISQVWYLSKRGRQKRILSHYKRAIRLRLSRSFASNLGVKSLEGLRQLLPRSLKNDLCWRKSKIFNTLKFLRQG
jgi:hypothetical protein